MHFHPANRSAIIVQCDAELYMHIRQPYGTKTTRMYFAMQFLLNYFYSVFICLQLQF